MTDKTELRYINGRFVQVGKIDAITELLVTQARMAVTTDALHMIQGSTTKDAEELKSLARSAIQRMGEIHDAGTERADAETEAQADAEETGQAKDAGEAS